MANPDDATFITAGNEEGIPFPDDDDEVGDMHVSESTRLHKKMREMKEMDDTLSAMKRDYARRIRLVKIGESRFLERQRNTIEYLRKFKQFIVETDSKRKRAENKEAEEQKMISQKNKELKALTELLADKKRTRDKKLAQHECIKQNQTYLEGVLSLSDQYSEIDDLLTRYKILEETNLDLMTKSREVDKEQENMQRLSTEHHRNKLNDILVKNSELARLLQNLELVGNTTSSLENEVITSEDKAKDLNRMFGEIQMATRNIHTRICNCYPTTPGLRRQQQKAQQTKIEESAQRDGNNKPKKGPEISKDEMVVKELISLLDVVAEKASDMSFVVSSVREKSGVTRRGVHKSTAEVEESQGDRKSVV